VNTNLVADTLESALKVHYARVYRNRAPSNPTTPYIVFNADSVLDTFPSHDYMVYVNIVDNHNQPVRAIETLADTIDNDLNHKVIDTTTINMHLERSMRQIVPANDLVDAQMVQIQYTVRVYFK
jgi:hypothetical protein